MSRRRLIVFPLGAFVIALWAVKLPYFAQGPGPAKDVEPLIRVTGHQEFPSEGHFILTSVSFVPVNAFEAIRTAFDPDRSLVPESAFVFPGETEEQANQRAISEMDQSKIDATAVVLSRIAGYPKAHRGGVLVEQVVGVDCPANGRLFPGDTILKVNGHPILSLQDFERWLRLIPASVPIKVQGRAGGEPFATTFRRRPCGDSKRALIGIAPIPTFPFRVSISSGDIGGPSAGLIWSLGLYDLLTPGDLSGGQTIAGTGTISTDGQVGPIGGVQDKIVAARHAGARTFLVPVDNYREASEVAGDMRLVRVRTFDQALRFLRRG